MERGGITLREAARRRARAASLAIAALLLVPAAASADTFTVNATGDGADATTNATCETAGGNGICTLRAAIEEANGQQGTDAIAFSPSVSSCSTSFAACTIQVLNSTGNGELDPLTEEVAIDGCSSDPNHVGPCVEIEMQSLTTGPDVSRGLDLAGTADDATIAGLAVTRAGIGIDYREGATGLTVVNNWFGVDLDGVTSNPDGHGVFLGGDAATIGGTAGADGASPATRNVFANATVAAIAIWRDADTNQVLGNYIGTLPDGTTAAGNQEGIRVTAPNPFAAEPDSNIIGGARSGVAVPECDGGCNVIAASTGDGINLQGGPTELPAGETTILGNYMGLDKSGEQGSSLDFANGAAGIRVGDADNVTIGSGLGEERNFIAPGPGGTGVRHGAGKDLQLLYNSIGLDAPGGLAAGAGSTGALIGGTPSPGDGAVLTGNRIAAATDGAGVVLDGPNSTLAGNTIGLASVAGSGGDVALSLTEDADGNAVGTALGPANVFGSATDAGIRIAGGDDNVVRRNLIGVGTSGADRGNGGSGIELADGPGSDPASGNSIGAPLPGDAVDEENQISHNAGDAIELTGTGTDNLIARNHGFDNGSAAADLFIDLGPDGAGNVGGPNGGIRMPVVSSATTEVTAGAGGSAEPGALVRVFRLEPSGGGRIDEFVGETTASAATGSWTLDYSSDPLPPGRLVTATQTVGQRTSELADPIPYDDVTPPVLEMSRPTPQRVLARRGVVVFGKCLSESCPAARATGRVVLAGRAFRFGSVSRALPRGGLRAFRLPASRSLLDALTRALAHRPYPWATITLVARDAAGNSAVARRKIKLRP